MYSSEIIGYLDCFSGVSGDMLLGALIHAGADQDVFRSEIAKLGLGEVSIEIAPKKSQSIEGLKVTISSEQRQELRTLPKIRAIFEKSNLDQDIVDKALSIFTLIGEAEAKVHGTTIDKIHFHEIGALDTIIDVVGTLVCIKQLGITKLYCSPLPLGRGFVNCDHGRLPLPAPAVCALLEKIPTYGVDIQKELVTPTGAAIVKGVVSNFGSTPPMIIEATGYGAGSHELPGEQPNLLRLIVGKSCEKIEAQEVKIVETNLDDWSPETFPHLCSILLEKNALDVNLTPIQVKKGRPGFKLQVICKPEDTKNLTETIFSQTTSIGLRYRTEKRITLPRKEVQLDTPWGKIQAKEVQTPDGLVIYPEYEECRVISEQYNISIQKVYRTIISIGEK